MERIFKLHSDRKNGLIYSFCKKGMVLKGVSNEYHLYVKSKVLVECNKNLLDKKEIRHILSMSEWLFYLKELEKIAEEKEE